MAISCLYALHTDTYYVHCDIDYFISYMIIHMAIAVCFLMAS